MATLQQKLNKLVYPFLIAPIRFTVYLLGGSMLLWSCGSASQESAEVQNSDTIQQQKEIKLVEASELDIPPALSNFDRYYRGNLGNKAIVVNLRRYGRDLSGSYWHPGEDFLYDLRGELQADEALFQLNTLDLQGNIDGTIRGRLLANNQLSGSWQASQTSDSARLQLTPQDNIPLPPITVNELEVRKESSSGNQSLQIHYPQLIGIQEPDISHLVNLLIERYFESHTLMDSIDAVNYDFKENVKFDIPYIGHEVLSITKHHHLSKNNDTQLFDDSHGLTLAYRRAKILELRDLFKPNAFEELNRIVLSRIAKSCGGALSEEELAACKLKPTESTSFSLSNHNKNITFHLTERLPYRYRGCGYVRIEYDDLTGLFNPSAPLNEKGFEGKTQTASLEK